MKHRRLRGSPLAILILVGIAQVGASAAADGTDAIRSLLAEQQNAWNRGDIDAFMNGYWRSEETVFVSGDSVTRGWQPVLEKYRKTYSDLDKMGTLTFSELDVRMLSGDAAVATGRWSLQRKADNPRGRFTLILRKMPEGWRIIHDHTSAADPHS